MIHTILYLGRLDLNLDRLHRWRRDFVILRPDNKGEMPVETPSRKVNGIIFGYMEHSGLGSDYEHRFLAVVVDNIALKKPVRLVPRLHTDGKRFGPRASLFGDKSAKRLLADMVTANPKQKTQLMGVYDRYFNSQTIPLLPEEIEITEADTLYEGAKCQTLVNAYERNSEARRKCIAHYGAKCVVCKFSFAEKYGKIGEGLIHVHHLRELSDIGEKYQVNPIKDLRPVCPNCHAIIHRRKPAYSISDVRAFIYEAAQSTKNAV